MHIRRALTLAARAGGCELRVVARRGEAGLIPVVPPLRTDVRAQFAVQQDGFRELAPRSAEVNRAVRDAFALKAAFHEHIAEFLPFRGGCCRAEAERGFFFIAVVAQAVDAHDVAVFEPRRRAAEDEVDIALDAAMAVDLPLRDARQELRRADEAVLLDFAWRQGRGEQRILAGFKRAVLTMEAVAVHIEGKRLTDLLARICAVLHRHVAECTVAGIDEQRCRAERAAFFAVGEDFRCAVVPSDAGRFGAFALNAGARATKRDFFLVHAGCKMNRHGLIVRRKRVNHRLQGLPWCHLNQHSFIPPALPRGWARRAPPSPDARVSVPDTAGRASMRGSFRS